MLNHQSVTRSGVPPFIVFWYQKVEWITLNYSVVTKPMSYNSVLFLLTKLLVMVSYGWLLSWFLVFKVGWRILNDSFCLWILWHMLFWWGFVCISIYGITFGLNLQIFHIIWKSESLLIVFRPIMNTRTWVTSLVCPEWRYQCCDSSEWTYITGQVISKRGRYIYIYIYFGLWSIYCELSKLLLCLNEYRYSKSIEITIKHHLEIYVMFDSI